MHIKTKDTSKYNRSSIIPITHEEHYSREIGVISGVTGVNVGVFFVCNYVC